MRRRNILLSTPYESTWKALQIQPLSSFSPQRYKRKSQNKNRHGKLTPKRAQATTRGNFTETRNAVKIIDNQIEFIPIPDRFKRLARLRMPCRFQKHWRKQGKVFPQAGRGERRATGKVRHSPYGPWGTGYRFTPPLEQSMGGGSITANYGSLYGGQLLGEGPPF